MGSELRPQRRKDKGNPVLSALFAGLSAVIAFLDWMELDGLLKSSLVHSHIDPFSWTLLEDAFLLLVGIGWLCFVFYSHHYYTVGSRKNRLLKRVYRVTGIQVLIIFVCGALLIVENGTIAFMGGDILAIVEGALGVLLLSVSRNKTDKGKTMGTRHYDSM